MRSQVPVSGRQGRIIPCWPSFDLINRGKRVETIRCVVRLNASGQRLSGKARDLKYLFRTAGAAHCANRSAARRTRAGAEATRTILCFDEIGAIRILVYAPKLRKTARTANILHDLESAHLRARSVIEAKTIDTGCQRIETVRFRRNDEALPWQRRIASGSDQALAGRARG